MEQATFLTLNYDTLLDTRFAEYAPLNAGDRDWYVANKRRWSLIKLHGSVNWGWALPFIDGDASLPRNSTEAFNHIVSHYVEQGFPEFNIDDIQVFRMGQELRTTRWDAEFTNTAVYYPALAMPLGPGDTLVCPSSHTRAANEALTRSDGLNLLVIGYSGLDDEVLRLLSESGNSIRRLLELESK